MNSKIYQLMGAAKVKAGQTLDAVEDFNKSVELDRLYSKAYYSR